MDHIKLVDGPFLTLISFSIFGVKILQQLTGFIDIDKINPDAWPALVADIAAGEQGIITLAFGEFAKVTLRHGLLF